MGFKYAVSTKKANDKIPDNWKDSVALIQVAQSQKQTQEV